MKWLTSSLLFLGLSTMCLVSADSDDYDQIRKPKRQNFKNMSDEEREEFFSKKGKRHAHGKRRNGQGKAMRGSRGQKQRRQQIARYLQSNNPELYSELQEKQKQWKSLSQDEKKEAMRSWMESKPGLQDKMKQWRETQFQKRLSELKKTDPEKAAMMEKRRAQFQNLSPEERRAKLKEIRSNGKGRRGGNFEERLQKLQEMNPEKAAQILKRREQMQNMSPEERKQFRSGNKGKRRGFGRRSQQDESETDTDFQD